MNGVVRLRAVTEKGTVKQNSQKVRKQALRLSGAPGTEKAMES